MPFVPSSFLLLVVRPGAPSSVLAPRLGEGLLGFIGLNFNDAFGYAFARQGVWRPRGCGGLAQGIRGGRPDRRKKSTLNL